jgi:hypothetical protein
LPQVAAAARARQQVVERESSRAPQYWQENLSRRNTLKRVKAGWVAGFT